MSNDAQCWSILIVGVLLIGCSLRGVASGSTKPFDCEEYENKQDNSTEKVLKNALLCGTGYDARRRPVKNQQDRVAMYIGADVMSVELVHNTYAKLEITVELSMQWYDAYLHWNMKQHENVQTLKVSERDIWTPTLSAKSLSRSPVQDISHCMQTKCHLNSDGEVVYSMLCTFDIDCLDASHNWAFETKDCPLRVFTPEYDINQLSLFHFQRRLSYSVAGVVPYKITSFQMAIVNNSVNPEFRMDIIVERMIGPHLVVFLVLILILMFLNLIITWFRIETTVRAVLSFSSLAFHVVFALILYWYATTKMDSASGLANLLLGSAVAALLLVGELIYSMKKMKKRDPDVPQILQAVHKTLTECIFLRPVLQLKYIQINRSPKELQNASETISEAANHVAQPEMTTKDTVSIEPQADPEEQAEPAQLPWSVFVQPFDRIIFCGIATAYTLMLLVLFLA